MEMEKEGEDTFREQNENEVSDILSLSLSMCSIKTEGNQESDIISHNGNLGKEICNDQNNIVTDLMAMNDLSNDQNNIATDLMAENDLSNDQNNIVTDLMAENDLSVEFDAEKILNHQENQVVSQNGILDREFNNKQDLKNSSKTAKDFENERLEAESFLKIVQAFKEYRNFYFDYFFKRIRYMKTLPPKQQTALTKYRLCIEQILKCVERNHCVMKLIIEDCFMLFENQRQHEINPPPKFKLKFDDIEKVQIVIKQLYRDWSAEGNDERTLCYGPILMAIESSFPSHVWKREDVKVLVPGAGLGRLAFEIAKRGFACQGNEFSMYMLLASNFVLNKSTGVNCYEIYPWITNVDNNLNLGDQLKMVRFPDEDPSLVKNIHKENRFSMTAGDFLEVYVVENEWDCVATCFFIDCAPNIYIFIEKIYEILKPGGVWINLGPLQYHYSQFNHEHYSIEPSFDVVKEIIMSIGFKIELERVGLNTKYSQNQNSMLKQEYQSTFLVCRKPI